VHFVADRKWQSPSGTGVIFVPSKASTPAVLQKAAADLGLNFQAVTSRPAGQTYRLTKPRIGLGDRYGGSMPSGWVRWLLEQYEFDYSLVFPQELNAGNLRAKYDVLLFPDGGIPENDNPPQGFFGGRQPNADDIPAEFRPWLGSVTVKETVPQLKRFADEGGTIVAFGGSAVLGHHLGLPIGDHIVETDSNGATRSLPRDKYYIPGSILRVAVDNTSPLGFGFEPQVDVMFDNSPVLRVGPAAVLGGVKPVAYFSGRESLRSGWAWGQHYLEGGVAAAEAAVGKGKVFLIGPEITFRAQPHGTFKFLFNGIFYGTATASGPARETTTQGQR
jgi:hypothetical protein